ncbi:hypothetical protein OG21DRAFT_1486637 [Imleria badia]|nr:hypothetical protein OG21DRAFT_1486637 [Imleria badia]
MALCLLLALSLLRSALALWPIPTALKTGTTPVILSSGFSFDVAIESAPSIGLYTILKTTSSTVLSSLLLPVRPSTASPPNQSTPGKHSAEYVSTIPADRGAAVLTANSTLGLYRGLTTFGQLWYYYGGRHTLCNRHYKVPLIFPYFPLFSLDLYTWFRI